MVFLAADPSASRRVVRQGDRPGTARTSRSVTRPAATSAHFRTDRHGGGTHQPAIARGCDPGRRGRYGRPVFREFAGRRAWSQPGWLRPTAALRREFDDRPPLPTSRTRRPSTTRSVSGILADGNPGRATLIPRPAAKPKLWCHRELGNDVEPLATRPSGVEAATIRRWPLNTTCFC